MPNVSGTIKLDGQPVRGAAVCPVQQRAVVRDIINRGGGVNVYYDGTDLYSLNGRWDSQFRIYKHDTTTQFLSQTSKQFPLGANSKIFYEYSVNIDSDGFYSQQYHTTDFNKLLKYNLYDWDEAPAEGTLSADNFGGNTYVGIRVIETTEDAIFTGTEGDGHGKIRRNAKSNLAETHTAFYGVSIDYMKRYGSSLYVCGSGSSYWRGFRKYSLDTLEFQEQSTVTWIDNVDTKILCFHDGYMFVSVGDDFAIIDADNLTTILQIEGGKADAVAHYKDNLYIIYRYHINSVTIEKLENNVFSVVEELFITGGPFPTSNDFVPWNTKEIHPIEDTNQIYFCGHGYIRATNFHIPGYHWCSNSMGEYNLVNLLSDTVYDIHVVHIDELGNHYGAIVARNIFVGSEDITNLDFDLLAYTPPYTNNIIFNIDYFASHGKGKGTGKWLGTIVFPIPILSGQQIGDNIDLSWEYESE